MDQRIPMRIGSALIRTIGPAGPCRAAIKINGDVDNQQLGDPLARYARGLESLWGMYQWLDRAPKGRNEAGIWWRRHDEYQRAAR